MRALFEAIVTIVFSFFLGMIAVVLMALYAPETLEAIQIQASGWKDSFIVLLTNVGAQSNVKVWVRFLLADEQLVFLAFTILARIFLTLFMLSLRSLWSMATGRH